MANRGKNKSTLARLYPQKVGLLVLFALFLSAALICFSAFQPTRAQAVAMDSLNFQARLQTNPGGAIVADGYYNLEFKLYNADTGGSALWTGTFIDTNGATAGSDYRVRVSHGYLSVALGDPSVNAGNAAFPTTINWDQKLYITMNVGGTTQTASPTWNGEMSPRLALGAVPYAFKAGQLARYNSVSGFTSTLELLQPTVGNQVFQIQDQGAAGTYNVCIQNSSSCGFATGSGAALLQGGNSFGSTVVMGANDANALQFKAGNAAVLTFNSAADNAYFGNAGTNGRAAAPTDFTLNGTGSSTAGTSGGKITLKGGAGETSGTGSDGGDVSLLGGTAGGSNARVGGQITITGGTGSATGSGGAVSLTSGAGGSTSGGSGTLTLATGNTTSGTAGNISIDVGTSTSGAPSISIGSSTNSPDKTVTIGGTNQTGTTTLGQSTATNTVNIGNGAVTGTQTINIGTGATGAGVETIAIGSTLNTSGTTVSGGSNGILLQSNGASAGTTVRSATTNSSSALRVQNTNNTNILGVGTTSPMTNILANPDFEVSTLNWVNKTGGILTRQAAAVITYYGQAGGQIVLTGANGGAAQLVTLTNAATYTLSFYAKMASGTGTNINVGYTTAGGDQDCLTNQTVVSGGFTRYSCTFTANAAGTHIYVKQNSAVSQTIYVDAFQLTSGAGASTPFTLGTLQLNGAINAPVVIQNTNDSTTAFQIQNATGTSNLLVADTLNNALNIGAKLVMTNTSNTNTATIQSGVTSSSYTLTLPTALGSSGDCLKDGNGSGALAFGTCVTTTIGAINGSGQAKHANGAVIVGSVLYLQTADASAPGLVSTGTQDIAGDKTLTGNTIFGGTINQTSSTGSDLHVITSTNTTTQTNGMLFNHNGSGTTTNGLNITNTTGTLTNGLSFTGTIGTDISRASGALSINGAGGINLQTGGTTTASLSSTGAALFKNSTDSATAFQIQDANAGALLTADTTNGQVIIGQKADTSSTNDTSWTKVSAATAGTIKTGHTVTAITSVTSSVVYNGSLYVGTRKADNAEIYRYDGGGNWTVINTTPGQFATGANTAIDIVASMAVYNGSLYIGTNETLEAELYRYNGGTGASVFTRISAPTPGTMTVGSIAGFDCVCTMAVFQGRLQFGANRTDDTVVYNYSGGTGGASGVFNTLQTNAGDVCAGVNDTDRIDAMAAVNGRLYIGIYNGNDTGRICYINDYESTGFTVINATAGSIWDESAGATLTGIDSISAMTAYNGQLVFTTLDVGGTINGPVVMQLQSDANTITTATATRLNYTYGNVINGGTTAITGFQSLTVLNGTLYLGTGKVLNGAEIYRYNSGFAGYSSWTKVSQATAGTVSAAGGSTTGIDYIYTMMAFNNKLYVGTWDTITNIAEVYENTPAITSQSYSLTFQASAGSTQQTGFPNQGSISFLGDAGSVSGANINTTGAFLFSNGIITQAGAYDVAEDYATRDESLVAGDIVAADPGEQEFVKKAQKATDTIVGVYSTKPALRLSQSDTTINGGKAVPIALAGRVPVRVSAKNGLIKPGDFITMSDDMPGVGVKATKKGFIVGRSLGFYNDADPAKVGTVMLFINLSWYSPDDNTNVAQSPQASTQNVTQQSDTSVTDSAASSDVLTNNNASFTTLTVTGDADFKGSVKIAGTLEVKDLQVSGHITTKGEAPKLELQPYAGSATGVLHQAKVAISGNDIGGKINLTVGDLPEGIKPGDLVKVVFSRRYSAEPQVMLTARNAQTAQLGAYVEKATEQFFIITVTNPTTPGTNYIFSYYVFQ